MSKAILVLEDGSAFEGVSIGAAGEDTGEVILNTSVVGYQELMTDAANAGKILVMTYPLIGNYGIAEKFYESKKAWVAGLIVKEASRVYSNWQAEGCLNSFLKKEGVVAISDIDTRTLAITIRDKGEMRGIISAKGTNKEVLMKKLKGDRDVKCDFIKQASTDKIHEIKSGGSGPKVAVLDLGVSNSFIAQMKASGWRTTLLPYDTKADDILRMRFDGLVISNGPEADARMPQVVRTIKELLGKIPILGISTGHEAIGLALGGKLKKMRVGHHGVNYPIKTEASRKGAVTVQNHSFIVDEKSIRTKKAVKITAFNINDNSVEEMESGDLKFISTQYCPASPGPGEVNDLFNRFFKIMQRNRRR